MKFKVELLAFGKPGEVREVEVFKATKMPPLDTTLIDAMLNEVFLRGQNEEDPQDHPSVSAGDVIHIGEDRWLIMAVGFKKLTQEDYAFYKSLDQPLRMPVVYQEEFLKRNENQTQEM